MNKPSIVEIPIKLLIKAGWNYKTEGTPEQVAKIAASIKHDSSAGVMAVREIRKKNRSYYEVIDGNHRLQAIKLLKWEKAHCENFGAITQAQAILIARRRNHVWFQDDVIKYAELFKSVVLPEYSFDDLEAFMPETREEMESLGKLLQFNWDDYTSNTSDDDEGAFTRAITLKVSLAVYEKWQKTKEKMASDVLNDDEKIFSYVLDLVQKHR